MSTQAKGGPITTRSLETGEVIKAESKVQGTARKQFDPAKTTVLAELSYGLRGLRTALLHPDHVVLSESDKKVINDAIDVITPIRDGLKSIPTTKSTVEKVVSSIERLDDEEIKNMTAEQKTAMAKKLGLV